MKRISKIGLFLLGILVVLCISDKRAYAAGQTTMFVGETESFAANINTYNTIKTYSWTLTGSGAYIANRSAHGCQVIATSSGKAYLDYSVTSTYTWYVYTDVQRTKKKYYTNTQVNRASWEITIGDPVNVSFDANGGSITTAVKQVGCGGGSTYGELPIPTNTGYVFDGWYTSAIGGTQITSSSIVTKNSEHTLYAHWIKQFSYTIQFDGNGSTGGTMEDMSCLYGETYWLNQNAYTKKGHRFVGWSTQSDESGTKYANKAQVRNLRKTEGTITLYAMWDDSNQASGTCGDNLTWIIDAEGTLVISGTGDMPAPTSNYKTVFTWLNYISVPWVMRIMRVERKSFL